MPDERHALASRRDRALIFLAGALSMLAALAGAVAWLTAKGVVE